MTSREVRVERQGWRCEEISARHRLWGFNCPSVDLDFLMVEFNFGTPVALVEYKHKNAAAPDLNHPTYRALRALADGYASGPLPFFIAIYCWQDWWFRIIPANQASADFYGEHTLLSEQQFVGSLYAMRRRALDENDRAIIAGLNATRP